MRTEDVREFEEFLFASTWRNALWPANITMSHPRVRTRQNQQRSFIVVCRPMQNRLWVSLLLFQKFRIGRGRAFGCLNTQKEKPINFNLTQFDCQATRRANLPEFYGFVDACRRMDEFTRVGQRPEVDLSSGLAFYSINFDGFHADLQWKTLAKLFVNIELAWAFMKFRSIISS